MLNETLIGYLEDAGKLEGNIEGDKLEGNIEESPIEVPIKDHNKLDNRDLPNQHPIEAIEGLKEELLSIKDNHQQVLLSIKKVEEKINNKIRTVKSIPTNMGTGEYIFLEKESEY